MCWISSWLLELIIKNSYLNDYSEKLFRQAYWFNVFSSQNSFFCQANCFTFQSTQNSSFVRHIKFKKRKALKNKISEELMPIPWRRKRWWNFCVSEDEKKEIEPILTE